MKMFINSELPSAKEYLQGKFKVDKSSDTPSRIKIIPKSNDDNANDDNAKGYKNILSPEDMEMLSVFGPYTIEWILINVLSSLFSIESSVRCASVIERIESLVRHNGNKMMEKAANKKKSKNLISYPFGTALIEFLIERGLIDLKVLDTSVKNNTDVKKKKGYHYRSSGVYVECKFDTSLLPIKLHLPMVYKPKQWGIVESKSDNSRLLSIFCLSGGYLNSTETNEGYNLLSSGDLSNFFLFFGNKNDKNTHSKAHNLCEVMNKLQNQKFLINEDYLNFIERNDDLLVSRGFLMPEFLLKINTNEIIDRVRRVYLEESQSFHNSVSLEAVMQILYTNIQRARYERTILEMASAYAGYTFYIPAFLDFRGRIYRSGILHFHERDLARSLILFDAKEFINNSQFVLAPHVIQEMLYYYRAAGGFHYKSFSTNPIDSANMFFTDVEKCVIEEVGDIQKDSCREDGFCYDSAIVITSAKAKNPFQWMMFLWGIFNKSEDSNFICGVPITQDASASAYQIMAYLLLNEPMAKRTNLITDPEKPDSIADVYSVIMDDLKSFLNKEDLPDSVKELYNEYIDRKLVKSIFMPIIYGKTEMSTAGNIKAALKPYFYPAYKESAVLASLCFKFWREYYKEMDHLIRLIRLIGWFASTCDSHVVYDTQFFSTCQDFLVKDSHIIWVYDKIRKKKRMVTLRLSSDKRDRKKTEVSTFVNFIHQKDALIAMKVVLNMQGLNAPIYTVHENFISNVYFCQLLPRIYQTVFTSLGPPLRFINNFFNSNIIRLALQNGLDKNKLGVNIEQFPYIVLTEECIDTLFNCILPETFKNKKEKLKVWNANVSRFKTYYFGYVRTVCCEDPRSGSVDMKWDNHEIKWEQFMSKIDGQYCVHY